LRLQLDVAEPPELTVRPVGLQVAVRPVSGETELDSARDPAKPLRLDTVTVDELFVPVGNVTVDGLELTEKSCIVTVTVAEWVMAPFEPVTVTV